MFHIHNCSHGEKVGEGKEPTRESETRRTNTLWPARVELEIQSNKIKKHKQKIIEKSQNTQDPEDIQMKAPESEEKNYSRNKIINKKVDFVRSGKESKKESQGQILSATNCSIFFLQNKGAL